MSRATITAHPHRPGCWVYRVPDLDRERAVPFAEGVVGDLATAYQRAAEALRRVVYLLGRAAHAVLRELVDPDTPTAGRWR